MQRRLKSAQKKQQKQNSQGIEVIEEEVRVECSKDCGQLNFSQYFSFFLLWAIFHYVYRLPSVHVVYLGFMLHSIWMLNVDAYRTAITLFQKDQQSKLFPFSVHSVRR